MKKFKVMSEEPKVKFSHLVNVFYFLMFTMIQLFVIFSGNLMLEVETIAFYFLVIFHFLGKRKFFVGRIKSSLRESPSETTFSAIGYAGLIYFLSQIANNYLAGILEAFAPSIAFIAISFTLMLTFITLFVALVIGNLFSMLVLRTKAFSWKNLFFIEAIRDFVVSLIPADLALFSLDFIFIIEPEIEPEIEQDLEFKIPERHQELLVINHMENDPPHSTLLNF